MLHPIRRRRGQHAWQVGEGVQIGRPDLGAAPREALQPRDLRQSHGRLEVGHVAFEAGGDDLIVQVTGVGEPTPRVLRQAVQRQHLDPVGQGFVGGEHHAAFGRGQVLGHIEAEAAQVAEGADRPPAIGGLDGVGAILDHAKPMALG